MKILPILCNVFIRGNGDAKKLPDLDSLDRRKIVSGCQRLFFKPYGLIISSGTVPGHYSYVDLDNNASYLTSSFLSNLLAELQTREPSWKRLFKITKSECYHLPAEKYNFVAAHSYQVNQYKVYLHPRRRSVTAYRNFLFKRCFGQNAHESKN